MILELGHYTLWCIDIIDVTACRLLVPQTNKTQVRLILLLLLLFYISFYYILVLLLLLLFSRKLSLQQLHVNVLLRPIKVLFSAYNCKHLFNLILPKRR